MKLFLFFLCMSTTALAQNFELQHAHMSYQVSHLIKTISGDSQDIKGKIQCQNTECEFLVASKIAAFTSSDSNRDLNMQVTTQASQYPVTSARGKINKEQLQKSGSFTLPIEVDFHGITKTYMANIKIQNNQLHGSFTLLLDSHGVERPSLFGAKIHNEVPMTLECTLIESKS